MRKIRKDFKDYLSDDASKVFEENKEEITEIVTLAVSTTMEDLLQELAEEWTLNDNELQEMGVKASKEEIKNL